ncbi:hypothetical protein JMJ77_0011337 [Colletotrichum scovillei]|uniref:Uncharacterized protein n=1 Tax=Colletotrichum scovillei TaxID=1209932 RepID=A0A9P7R4B7_9PEZI|nr:hypothetical protein JMJ77_0011337 [Colletotrichum scovillei]KAG7060317.1 hypothetical protein JMJ78_0015592 [Colletotrichum scovillei]KAG7067766.1 hypothetical protein JMJ76_0009194 [Colletotrichum scovillei]
MLRLDPTVIRITLSEVKQYERQRKAQDRGGRGNDAHSSRQAPTSGPLHDSLRLRFVPDSILPDQERIEIYDSPTAFDHRDDDDDGETVVDDSEKINTSPSESEDEREEDRSESMEDAYEDRLPGLNTPRLPLPLPFSATARVTTATNHPGNVIRLPRGMRHGEPRRIAHLSPETLSTRAAAVISRHDDLSTRQTLRQITLHNNDAANTWQSHAPGDSTEAQQHGRLQPPFLPSMSSPSSRSPRQGERANITARGIPPEAIRQLGVTVDSEETSEQGMSMRSLVAPSQHRQDEVQNLEDQ